ncbi:MAG TPA: peptide ABC transporter substrate-binding protein [Dehalococcoidia bacterium]|jgi:oligopeptide transport system substrate-binding protein
MEIRKLVNAKWFATAFAVLALTMAACSGDKDTTDSSGAAMKPDSPDKQVLRLRLQGEPKTIDPHLSNQAQESTINRQLFAGLFTYNDKLDIVPNLARELPTVANGGISADGTTYTVKIKDGAKWSDGKPLTAQDFVYSMQRAMDPITASPYASFFYSIAGASAYNSALGKPDAPKTPTDQELASLRAGLGVSARDDSTVVYKLTQPNPSFLNLLALWTAFPVRQDVVEQNGAKWTEAETHIGDGPFKLSEWRHNEKMVLTPNPYWVGEKPLLQRVEIFFIADDFAAYQAYQADEIDVVTVPPAAIKEVSTAGHPYHDQLTIEANLATFALFMNNKVAPFDNQLVRKAFGTAIDRQAYVDGLLQGGGVPTTSWIPPGMPGYNEKLGSQYGYDPAKAKDLLKQAGYPNGEGLPKVTFIAVNSDTNKLVGQFIQQQLKQNLGVDVEFNYVEGKEYGRVFTQNLHQATIQRWSADWPYPDNWLPDLFTSGALNNHAGYSNAKFDDLMRKGAAETENAKRLALYDEAHKLMIDDAGVVPLYNPVTHVLVKPWVQNWQITGIDGYIKGDVSLYKAFIASGN